MALVFFNIVDSRSELQTEYVNVASPRLKDARARLWASLTRSI